MEDVERLKEAKRRCLADIREALPLYADRLNAVDGRLLAYIEDAISGEGSHANLYELLGIRKELRLMGSYAMDVARVQRTLRAIEGQWKGGRHVKGGLRFSTPRGSQHVRLMPFQTWLIFEIYAFTVDVCMEREWHEGDVLLPTEWVGPTPDPSRQGGEGDADGIREERTGRAGGTALESAGTAAAKAMVWDTRRLTQEAHWFLTRKSGKTELGAAVDFVEVCFLGDINGQALICTNSSEQSQIAYKAIRWFAMQVDSSCVNRLGGKFFRMTRNGLNWQPGHRMKGEIKCLSAGKTSKDGLYASVVHADEHGQARYINGTSDMQSTVETAWGSTGPRREKLLLHTTTAGRVKDGPYKTKIEQVEAALLKELDYPLGKKVRTPDDSWCAFLLQLDKWELTDDLTKLDDPELFKKVNRSIGTTVQPTYYRERLHEAMTGTEDTKQEVLTKDFNIWQTGRVVQWIKGDKVRELQVDKRIENCRYVDGWQVFVGLDFSQGDDLFAVTYLGVNYKPSETMRGKFFADCEAWVLEETMKQSPNRPLYEAWVEQGWLQVCPGEVFDSTFAINRLAEKTKAGVNMVMFGFDPAQSAQPINHLKAWLQTLFQERPDIGAKDMAAVIKQMVVPVSQTAMTQNPRIGELEHMMLEVEPWLEFSASPLWPWCFGNAAAELGNSDLRRIIKGGPQATHKIDPVHGLLDALYCFDLSEGRIE